MLTMVRVQRRPVCMTVCISSFLRPAKQTAGRAALQVHLSLSHCVYFTCNITNYSVFAHTCLTKHCPGAAAPHMFRCQLTYECSVSAGNVCPCARAESASLYIFCHAGQCSCYIVYAKHSFSWPVPMQRLVTCNNRSAQQSCLVASVVLPFACSSLMPTVHGAWCRDEKQWCRRGGQWQA